MKRGEVYWASLSPHSASEQQGTRPVIIVSHDGFNRAPVWKSVIVVPVSTSLAQARRVPTVVLLPAGVGGVPQDSVALCHQVTTPDRSKLTSQLGELSESLLNDIGEALKTAQSLQ